MSDHPNFGSVEARVQYIAELMSEDRWRTRVTERELAQAWDLSVARIRNLATEASRSLRIDAADRDALRAALMTRMDRIARDALATVNTITGLPDYGSAIKASEAQAKFAGLDADAGPAERPAPPTIRIVTATEPTEPEPKPDH